jgi:hypothetical protein
MAWAGSFSMQNNTDLEVQISQDHFAILHKSNDMQGRVYVFTEFGQLAAPIPAHITFVRRTIIDGQQHEEQIPPEDPGGNIGFLFIEEERLMLPSIPEIFLACTKVVPRPSVVIRSIRLTIFTCAHRYILRVHGQDRMLMHPQAQFAISKSYMFARPHR